MNITPSEAADALAAIEMTAGRTQTRRSYRIAGPILILWGVIWLAGYGALDFVPRPQWSWLWLALDLAGVAGTIWLVLRGLAAAGVRAAGLAAWRPFLWGLAIMALVGATYSVLQPRELEAILAYPGIVAGFCYVVFGLIRMPRMAWTGLAIFTLTLVGFFAFPDILTYWMAGVGGGGLILGGVWLRSA